MGKWISFHPSLEVVTVICTKRYKIIWEYKQKVGRPHIFVTMGSNPNWVEIKRKLGEVQKLNARPNIFSRPFRMKMKHLTSEVMDIEVFETFMADLRVVEFQKRELSHAHCIFSLSKEEREKMLDQEHVDRLISEEIPRKRDPYCITQLFPI